MVDTIKSVFDDECKDLVIDKQFVDRLMAYTHGFVTANEDHINFFGGNLLGVETVRFKPSDRDQWFDDVLECDDLSLNNRIKSLPTINTSFHVSSDIMNLSTLWLLHAIERSKLDAKTKHIAQIEVMLALHYKLLTSLMSEYFKYPADKSVALATYAALSKKFALRAAGSWSALLLQRAEDIIGPTSIHRKRGCIDRFDNDDLLVKMINDIQGRIREVVKKITKVFYRIRDKDARINTSSSIITLDGDTLVRDKTNALVDYKRYIHQVVPDSASFIRDELVSVVCDAMYTMPERLLRQGLQYMSDNYFVKSEQFIIELIDETLVHAFEFIHDNKDIINYNADLAGLVTKIRAVYMSARSTDPSLILMRELGEKITVKSTHSHNATVVASVRTGLLLYIVIRTLAMKHYQ